MDVSFTSAFQILEFRGKVSKSLFHDKQFKSRIWLLIAPVPVHCVSIAFKNLTSAYNTQLLSHVSEKNVKRFHTYEV